MQVLKLSGPQILLQISSTLNNIIFISKRTKNYRLHLRLFIVIYLISPTVCVLGVIVIKNVSSSTTNKKTLKLPNCQTLKLWNYEILAPANPSPNYFPTLCKQFSARFPLKGRGTWRFPLLQFDLIFEYASIPIIPTFFACWYILADNLLW